MGRTMKDSGVAWIGKMPEAWRVLRISEVLSETSKKGSSSEPVLSASQSMGVVFQSKLPQRAMSSDENKRDNFKKVIPGQFVVSLRSFEGGVEYAWDEGIISPAYTVCRLKNGNKDYFRYLFKSTGFIEGLSVFMKGIRDGQSISFSSLRTVMVPFPNFSEQSSIAVYLDRETDWINRQIDLIENRVSLLAEYRKAIIFEAVTKGLDKTADMKDSGVAWIGKMPAEWETKRLKEISNIETGSMNTEDREDEGIYPFYVRSETVEKSKRFTHDREAILVPGEGLIGEVFHLAKGKHAVHQRVYSVQPKKTACIRFIRYSMMSGFGAWAKSSSNTVTVESLRRPTFLNFSVPQPSLSIQKAIAAYLDRETALIDEEIALIQRKATLLTEYRKALIFEAVTGKIEVPSL